MPLTFYIISSSINAKELKFSLEMVLMKIKIYKIPGWLLSGPYFARQCASYAKFTYLKIYKCSGLQISTRSASHALACKMCTGYM